MTAHLGPGLRGIKETGWEKVLFAPATANFPAPRDPANDGIPHPTAAVPGWAGLPWPAGTWGQEPPPCRGSPAPSVPQHGPGTRGRAEQSSGGAGGKRSR